MCVSYSSVALGPRTAGVSLMTKLRDVNMGIHFGFHSGLSDWNRKDRDMRIALLGKNNNNSSSSSTSSSGKR
jgi:hypothetical protein